MYGAVSVRGAGAEQAEPAALRCAAHGAVCSDSGESMASSTAGLWRLLIPMIVLSHFSSSFPSRER